MKITFYTIPQIHPTVCIIHYRYRLIKEKNNTKTKKIPHHYLAPFVLFTYQCYLFPTSASVGSSPVPRSTSIAKQQMCDLLFLY